jgi:hypothetical protein
MIDMYERMDRKFEHRGASICWDPSMRLPAYTITETSTPSRTVQQIETIHLSLLIDINESTDRKFEHGGASIC